MARQIAAVLLGNQLFSNMIFQIRSNTTLNTRNINTVSPIAAKFLVIKHEYIMYAPTKYCDNRMDLSYSYFVRKKTAITFDNAFIYININITVNNCDMTVFPSRRSSRKWCGAMWNSRWRRLPKVRALYSHNPGGRVN